MSGAREVLPGGTAAARPTSETTAVALVAADGRFFAGTTARRWRPGMRRTPRRRSIAWAWSLAGARLFLLEREDKIEAAEKLLRARGAVWQRRFVTLDEATLW